MTRGDSGGKTAVPRHPAVRYAVVACCLLAVFAVLGLALLDRTGPFLPIVVGVVSIAATLWLIHVMRIARPVQHNNSAVNAMLAGRPEEAEPHLIEAERSNAAILRTTTKIMRAQLCLHRAQLDEARQYLDTALSQRLPWLGRFHARLAVASARGIRALVHALRGDQAGAEADIAALERLTVKRPETLAAAALAGAVLLRRAGDRAALREFLDRHRTLLFEFTSPRERALVRALSWSTRQRDVAYRTPTRSEARSAQEGLGAWLDAVLPGAGDLAEDLRDTDQVGAASAPVGRAAEAREPAADHVRTRIARPEPPLKSVAMPARGNRTTRTGLLWPTIAVWVVLIVTFLVSWQFLAPDTPPEGQSVSPEENDLSWAFWAGPAAVLVLFVSILAALLWRGRREQRALLKAAVLIAKDTPAAHDLLVRLTRSSLIMVSAQAHLSLAGLGERAGDFGAALAHADAALQKLRPSGARAMAYDLLLPEIHAMRALAFAGLDRMSEASVELAAIEHDFPAFYLLERSKVRVLQLLAARAGDYKSAAQIATGRSPDLPISYRDDVLGELAEIVARGTAVERTRLNRLRHEIDGDPVLAHWLEVAAPRLMARFDDLRAA